MRAREGGVLSNFQSSPAACTVGAGLFSRREILFPESEKSYIAGSAPGDFEEILAETVKGEVVEGEAVPPLPAFRFYSEERAILQDTFEIVVVGAGHAGCEAALACARASLFVNR